MKPGFNNTLYVKKQTENIKKRFNKFDKLYLEVGGKLFDDNHAARVLPGFMPDSKIKMFLELKNDLEIVFVINSKDIEKNKMRAEYGLTYDMELIRLINKSKSLGFTVNSVVITLYNSQPIVDKFIKRLNRQGVKTYLHYFTKGYPNDVDTIVSDEGYGKNDYIKTTKKLILVNAPGPGSGKLATCLSQLYHDHKNNINAGYAKFETFPVWNLGLNHPVNLAYEAATADLKDVNMVDYFHKGEYGIESVNYNRDLEAFPLLKNILNKITGSDIYKSPTDMGVNMVGFCIEDDKIVREASKKEIIRRYYQELNNFKLGKVDEDTPLKVKKLMDDIKIEKNYLCVVEPALAKSKKEKLPVISLELSNGKIITGKQTELLTSASSLILNAIKILTNIPDEVNLLSPAVINAILNLKNIYNNDDKLLTLQDTLLALSISSVTNPIIETAIKNISKLENCDAHSSHMITNCDLKSLKNLKINITCEAEFYTENLI